MGGAEVTAERLAAHQAGAWSRHFAAALDEAARLAAANEAIVGRVRELEQELADLQRINQQISDQNNETQQAIRAVVEERDALAGRLDSAGRQFDKQMDLTIDKWSAASSERDRLRQLVRDLGGDPEPPGEPSGATVDAEPELPSALSAYERGEDPAPVKTNPDGHAVDCSPASVTGCAPWCPLAGTPGERPIPAELGVSGEQAGTAMRTKADEIRESQKRVEHTDAPVAPDNQPEG